MTGRQGSYAMEPAHYEPVPSQVQHKLVAARGPQTVVPEE